MILQSSAKTVALAGLNPGTGEYRLLAAGNPPDTKRVDKCSFHCDGTAYC